MVATQLITYLRNHLYLPHLDLLLYFNPDNHNSELFLKYILLQPILEPHQIHPLQNNLLNHTSHLLPQLPRNSLPDLLLHHTYIGLHNRHHHYPVPPPALLSLRREGGGGIRIIWDRGVRGDYFQSSGSFSGDLCVLFLIFNFCP